MGSRDTPRWVSAAKTGDATVAPGGYANTGVHVGDINLSTGVPVQTSYLRQVRRIAPAELIDRDSELADLSAFCTEAQHRGSYAWWRADAWSGKSALLSTFVLDPPPGVRIVSFFITARLGGQNTRAAFVSNVLEQLAAILGSPMPPSLSEWTQDAHLLGMLAEAAAACEARGEHFVLLVDGLDEEVTSTGHSIAALLPGRLEAGMRVIVAGRPNPPIPQDVPDDHPLRDEAIVRPLAASTKARAVRHAMETELENVLSGTAVEQDLVGLLTAAGGGLTARDLAELTGLRARSVERYLATVAGRSFARRPGQWQPAEIYLLGHEEIAATAAEILGPDRLAGYRQQLHTWADRYRDRGWPGDTPEYLLLGYVGILTATNDIDRLVTCATDSARHLCMLDLSGGDATALGEIAAVQDLLLVEDQPDLVAMARLSVHRAHLTERNANIPLALPAVWTLLGRHDRAEALARSMTGFGDKPLILMAVAAAETGATVRAQSLIDAMDAAAQASAMGAAAEAAAATGQTSWAQRLASRASDRVDELTWDNMTTEDEYVLTDLIRAMTAGGKFEEAEAAARLSTQVDRRANALTLLAQALLAAGKRDRALAIATEMKDPRQHDGEFSQSVLMNAVTRILVASGDLDKAEKIANSIRNRAYAHDARATIARGAAKTGDIAKAEQLADSLSSSAEYAGLKVDIFRQVSPTVDDDVIDVLIEQLPADTAGDKDGDMANVVGALAATGHSDRAIRLAHSIVDRSVRLGALTGIAGELAKSGYHHEASSLASQVETAARATTGSSTRVDNLGSVMLAAAAAGWSERANDLAGAAESMIQATPEMPYRDETLMRLAEKFVTRGDINHALRLVDSVACYEDVPNELESMAHNLARSGFPEEAVTICLHIRQADVREPILEQFAVDAARAGDVHRTMELIHEISHGRSDRRDGVLASVSMKVALTGAVDTAESMVHQIANVRFRSIAEQALVKTALWFDDIERAAEVARSISDDYQRSQSSLLVIEALVAAGELDRASHLTETAGILGVGHRATALRAIAEASGTATSAKSIGRIFRTESWTEALDLLARDRPEVVAVIADEMKRLEQL